MYFASPTEEALVYKALNVVMFLLSHLSFVHEQFRFHVTMLVGLKCCLYLNLQMFSMFTLKKTKQLAYFVHGLKH